MSVANKSTRALLFVVLVGAILAVAPQSDAQDDSALNLLIQTLDNTEDAGLQSALMRGILSGLAGQRNVTPPDNWSKLKEKLDKSNDSDVRKLTQQLAQIFGDQAAARKALATLRDSREQVEVRRSALLSLLTQRNKLVMSELESLIDQSEHSALRLDAIRGYAVVEHPKAPEILLQRYGSLDILDRRAVIETLSTRKAYAGELLKAIENKMVKREDVPPYVARSLNRMLGDSFTKIYGEVPDLTKGKSALIAAYKKLLTPEKLRRADAAVGRAVYKKTCAACHIMFDDGGKIGPELTGSNRANLDYILLNTLDPSYDVPEGYKMVVIETVDGLNLSGIVAEEDNQRVVLKTVEQASVVIAKTDIEDRFVSELSLMPDGQLQALKRHEVIALIKYLQTKQQVELPK